MPTQRTRTVRFSLVLGLAACAPGCVGPSIAPQPATPQRPTVSSNTATTAEGTFELEAGVVLDPNDTYSTPMTLKWGQSERTELFVGWSPYLEIDRPGDDAEGSGDVLIGTRHRFFDEPENNPSLPSLAFQLATKLPTSEPNEGLGSGEVDWFGALIASNAVGRLNTTAFLEFGLIGDPARPGAVDEQITLALAADFPAGERAGVFGELTGQWVPERDTELYQVITGGTFTVSPSWILDAALVIGLSDDAPDLQLLIGSTKNHGAFGRLAGRELVTR